MEIAKPEKMLFNCGNEGIICVILRGSNSSLEGSLVPLPPALMESLVP